MRKMSPFSRAKQIPKEIPDLPNPQPDGKVGDREPEAYKITNSNR